MSRKRREFWGVHEQLDPPRKRPGLGTGSFAESRKSLGLGQREIWMSRKRPGLAGREICCVQEAAGAWPGMIELWESRI